LGADRCKGSHLSGALRLQRAACHHDPNRCRFNLRERDEKHYEVIGEAAAVSLYWLPTLATEGIKIGVPSWTGAQLTPLLVPKWMWLPVGRAAHCAPDVFLNLGTWRLESEE